MGKVYEARHTSSGKRCAVKLLNAPGSSQDLEIVQRFVREARACSVLESDHVVEVFDSGFDAESDTHYMVMELLQGEDLEKVVKRSAPLPPSVAARIALQAATGLAKAHRMGILHRDLKPANLFLAERDSGEIVVKILDFGVAKVRVESSLAISGALTRTGHLLGTPLYMSPEQIRGDADLDGRSDVWSLGVVLFEMLSGVSPFATKTSFGELMVSILTMDLPWLQDLAPWVDPKLAAITHRAMSRSLEQRYPDAEALRVALLEVCDDGRLHRREIESVSEQYRRSVAPRLALTPMTMLQVSAPSSRQPRRPSSAAVLAIAAALGVVVALLTSGIIAMGSTGDTPGQGSSTLAGSPHGSAAPAPVERRTFRLRVPDGARVEVGGVPVPVQDRRITIAGAVGEIFSVRLTLGALSSDVRVVLSEQGPVPESLELPVAAAAPSAEREGSAPTKGAAQAEARAAPPALADPPGASARGSIGSSASAANLRRSNASSASGASFHQSIESSVPGASSSAPAASSAPAPDITLTDSVSEFD